MFCTSRRRNIAPKTHTEYARYRRDFNANNPLLELLVKACGTAVIKSRKTVYLKSEKKTKNS